MTTRTHQGPPTLQELKSNRDRILRLAERRGAGNVRVFGSVVAGTAREFSDIDILVTLAPGRSVVDVAGLKLDLEELLGRRVDVLTEGAMKPRLRSRVLEAARPL